MGGRSSQPCPDTCWKAEPFAMMAVRGSMVQRRSSTSHGHRGCSTLGASQSLLIYRERNNLNRFCVAERTRITNRLLLCWTQEHYGWKIKTTRGGRSLMTLESKLRLVSLSDCIGYVSLGPLLKIVYIMVSIINLLDQLIYTLLNNGYDIWLFYGAYELWSYISKHGDNLYT